MLDEYCLFRPARTRPGGLTPTAVGLQYEDVLFPAADGVTLHGWFVPGRNDITLLVFRGSAGNLSDEVYGVLTFHEELGVSIFVFDYRQFGASEGRVSEEGTYRDADGAVSYLCSRHDVNPCHIVFYGYSLGSGVAVEAATRYHAFGVILEAPFTSIAEIAKTRWPLMFRWVPFCLLIHSRYDSLSKIRSVTSPLFVVHGDRDDSVPYPLGRRIFEAANPPKCFYTVRGGGHDTYAAVGPAYYETLRRFIEAPDQADALAALVSREFLETPYRDDSYRRR